MGVLGITSKQLRSWATNQRFRHVNFKAVNYYHHFINNLELTKPLVRDAYTLLVSSVMWRVLMCACVTAETNGRTGRGRRGGRRGQLRRSIRHSVWLWKPKESTRLNRRRNAEWQRKVEAEIVGRCNIQPFQSSFGCFNSSLRRR
jgi:hypothetical protein